MHAGFPHPAGVAKEMLVLQPLRRLQSLASVLGGDFLLNETLANSGTGIQEGAKLLCPQPSFNTILPHHGLQVKLNGMSVSSIRCSLVLEEKVFLHATKIPGLKR